MTRLNPHLRNVDVPFGVGGTAHFEKGHHWVVGNIQRGTFSEQGMPFAQHLYGFPGFSCVSPASKRAQLMWKYPESAAVLRTVPGTEP